MMKGAYDTRDYDNSFGQGLWQVMSLSIKLSFIFALVILFISHDMSPANQIPLFIGAFMYISLLLCFTTLICTTFIAFPTIKILKYFHLDNKINAALVGGFISFATTMWISAGDYQSKYYFIVLYGLICGYVFMSGYQKGTNQ